MTATLASLEIPSEKLPICQDEIRKLAYFKWLEAGCPQGQDADFWKSAEHEWIEFQYVPDRLNSGL
jgi:hypothetical protein